MAAFDRVLSGIPEMDKALDNIRLGDNVVWRVSDLNEFRLFMEPYVRQAVKDKRKIIYFRFASHEPFITDVPEVETITMLRLVMGLGTSAVDRTEGSYPRLVSLDMPERSVYSSAADRHKFSQRNAEVINSSEKKLETVSLDALEPVLSRYMGNVLLEHDFEAEQRLSEMGRYRAVRFISCQGLVKNKKLMDSMRRMLARIQSEYDYPVDTEFTINFSDDGEYTIDLLQCRPLQVVKGKNSAFIPKS